MKPLYLILPFILLLSACSPKLLVLEDVLPSARFEQFEPRIDQSSFEAFELGMVLTFRYRNPYNKALQIPLHRMGIRLNDGQPLRGVYVDKDFSIPAKESVDVEYPFILSSASLRQVLGRENTFTFETDLEIDLSDYTDMLPNYQVRVTDRFGIDSSLYNPVIKKLTQRNIDKYELHLEKSVRVKIPALPQFTVSNDPIKVEWLGGGWAMISPDSIKNVMEPFVDLMLDGTLSDFAHPFVDAMENTSVTVPAPKWNCWNCTTEINLADHTLALASAVPGVGPAIYTKYNDLKDLLLIDNGVEIADYFVDNYLTLIDPNADNIWDQFENGWAFFKNMDLPNSLPSPATRGFRISFPFVFQNTNDFPVAVPLFRNSAFLGSGEPFTIELRPASLNRVSLNQLPGTHMEVKSKENVNMYVTFSVNWVDSSSGIYGFMTGQNMEPDMRGVMSFDMGFGPMYVKYNLNDLILTHE